VCKNCKDKPKFGGPNVRRFPVFALLLAPAPITAKTNGEIVADLLVGYDKHTRPTVALYEPLGLMTSAPADNVSLQIGTKTIPAVDQKGMSYTIEGYMRIWWRDARLAWNSTGSTHNYLVLQSAASLWTPDVYLESTAGKLSIGDGHAGELVWIYDDGSIFWSRQARLPLRCNMGFGRLPFDKQHCLFLLGIFSETAADVRLSWRYLDDPLGAQLGKGPRVKVVGGEWGVSQIKATDLIDSYPSGDYSYAKACITFERLQASEYMNQVVLSIVFVIISYAGFWVNPAAAPGRIALGVITTLIVTNSYTSVRTGLPKVAYPVFLMDFLFGCMMFNVCAFLAYVMVNFGMTVDGQLEQLRKANIVIDDADDDGVLDWSEFRAAMVKMIRENSLALTGQCRSSGERKSSQTSPTKSAQPEAPKEKGDSISAEQVQISASVVDIASSTSPSKRRGSITFNFDQAQWAKGGKECLGILPGVGLFKPEGVRYWRDLDRHFRWIFPVGFLIYVLVFLNTSDLWDRSALEIGQVENCGGA